AFIMCGGFGISGTLILIVLLRFLILLQLLLILLLLLLVLRIGAIVGRRRGLVRSSGLGLIQALGLSLLGRRRMGGGHAIGIHTISWRCGVRILLRIGRGRDQKRRQRKAAHGQEMEGFHRVAPKGS